MDIPSFFSKAKIGDKARVDAMAFKELLQEHERILDKLAEYETKQLPAVSDLMYRGTTTFGNYLTPKDLSKLPGNKDVRVTAGELREVCFEYMKLKEENIRLRAEAASNQRELSKLSATLSTTTHRLEEALESIGSEYNTKVYDVVLTKGLHFDKRS